MRARRVVTPYWAVGGSNSWGNTFSCKLFMPCDGLVDGGLVDKKTGAIAQSNETIQIEYDSALNAVSSTDLVDAVGSSFSVTGDYLPHTTGKHTIFLCAGYLHYESGETNTAQGCRVRIGGSQYTGDSDGRLSLAPQHTVFAYTDPQDNTYLSGASYNAADYAGSTETDIIDAAVGVGGFFYKYVVYKADGNTPECKIRNGSTGAEIGSYSSQTGVDVLPSLEFGHSLKFSGIKMIGLLRLEFDSVPTDYLNLMFYQVSEWKRGNRIVLKQWDQ